VSVFFPTNGSIRAYHLPTTTTTTIASRGSWGTKDRMKWMPRWLGAAEAASDEEAMRRVQRWADPAAFAQLVHRWEGPIRRLCVRMTGDEHRGEDLAQDAFARVFANRHRFEPTRRFSTWLWRIALNLCYEEARKLGRRGDRVADLGDESATPGPGWVADDDAGPEGRAVRAERVQLVRTALARLPESHRAVVVLREYENLKFREIAEVLDVPEGTVKWRMAEAMNQLSEQLKPILAAEADVSTPATDVHPAAKVRLAL
jgi:RNA polymerase sigma-70 factor (ECF subfamily)